MPKYIDTQGLHHVAEMADARYEKIGNLQDNIVTRQKLAPDVAEELDSLDNKANIDGSYDDMTVGNAKQVLGTVGVEDQTPYSFRTSGGSIDIGDRENVKAIVGGTVCWNQLVENGNFASTDSWEPQSSATSFEAVNNVGKMTITRIATGRANLKQTDILPIVGHKYLITLGVKISSDRTDTIGINFLFGINTIMGTIEADEVWHDYVKIISIAESTYNYMMLYESAIINTFSVGDTIEYRNVQAIDLTAMFGPTIADYIYSLEQATAGAGVAWFRKLFTKNYYAYNAGELMSVKASAHKMVGFNLLKSFVGINTNKELPFNKDNAVRVINGMQYEFNHGDISSATSWRHAVICYDLDGNKISESGLITTSTGGMAYNSSGAYYVNNNNGTRTADQFTTNFDGYIIPFVIGGDTSASTMVAEPCVHIVWSGYRNGEYEPYEEHEYVLDSTLELRGILKLDANNNLYYDGDTYAPDDPVTRCYGIRAYQSGDESLSDAITDGTNTVYKLATPTTESAEQYQETQVVNDFGTEEFVDYAVEQGLRDVAIPVGSITKYLPNLRDKLQNAPNSPSSNGLWVVQRINGANVYIPLATALQMINNGEDQTEEVEA